MSEIICFDTDCEKAIEDASSNLLEISISRYDVGFIEDRNFVINFIALMM